MGGATPAAGDVRPGEIQRLRIVLAHDPRNSAPDPARWPSIEACAAHLDDGDPVVALMAAQMLKLHRTWRGADLGSPLRARVRERMAAGQAMRWRPPA